MNAREQLQAGQLPRRLAQLLIGLGGYGCALTVLARSGLGPPSWSVLAQGIAQVAGISFGWATNLVAVVVLVAWCPLRELPGLGTLLNVVVVGLSADLAATVLPAVHGYAMQALSFACGLVALALCDAIYLGAQCGSGPRDGIMTGLTRTTGAPIAVVRTIIEVSVGFVGWLLGGSVGCGTVVIALSMGPLVAIFLPRVTVTLHRRRCHT